MKRVYKRARLIVAALVATWGLAGCFGPDPWAMHPDPSTPHTVEAARALFADRTRITYSSFHGTQIEYHRADGKAFLWYQGNSVVVPSNWKVSEYGLSSHAICWQYPSRSYNPVTGETGGHWECQPASTYNGGLEQLIAGDPFRLSSGRIPFRLPKGKLSAQELYSRMGQNPANLSILYTR